MRSIRFPLFLFFVFLAVLILPSCSDNSTTPQTGTTDVLGIVRDEQAFVVPNALVEVLGTDNSIVASAITDETGAFSLPGMTSDRSKLVVRVTHEDFIPIVSSFKEILASTGPTVNLVHLIHGDSSCGRISMLVRDVNTLAALAGAEVRLTRNKSLVTVTSTDATGRVQFNFLRDGSYALRISKQGYKVVEREVRVQFCDSTSLDIRMSVGQLEPRDSCCHAVVRVTVLDSLTNAPLTNVQVKLSGPAVTTKTLVLQGNAPVEFRDLCPGSYSVRISRDHYKVQEMSLVLTCNEQRNITVRLKPAAATVDSCCHGRLTVTAIDSLTNNPIANMTIKLWKANTVYTTRVTSQNGMAIFENLCPGSYMLSGLRDNSRGIEMPVTLGCNQVSAVTFLVKTVAPPPPDSCCHGRLTVMVKDSATGFYLANATVKLWYGGAIVATKTTTPNGAVVFENLCAKNYGISVLRDGYSSKEKSVTMACNDIKTETVILKSKNTTVDSCNTARLKFIIKNGADPTQPPLPGVEVRIMINNSSAALYVGLSDQNGYVIRDGLLAPAVYTVVFIKQGFATKSITYRFDSCKTIQETITMTP